MRTRVVILVALMLPAFVLSADVRDYFGIWTGTVVEGPITGSEHKRYEVSIGIAPGKYTIEYPSLNCGGKLHLSGSKGRHFSFRDELEYGLDQCSTGGRTELQFVRPDLMAYQWFDVNGVLRAEGMLKRRSLTMVMLTF